MKFVHLSDLHLGKRFNEFSLMEDQKYILEQILDIIKGEEPDGVIIAGDVYDKSTPSAEAVRLLDDFLYKLSEFKVRTFVISGNHDSAERIAFGARIMQFKGIYMSPVYEGKVTPISLNDDFGEVNVYMLPFIKPAHVRKFHEDERKELFSYTDAVAVEIKNMNINTGSRNLLITHQFVTGAVRSDSEEISLGGSDNVDVSVFDDFDYVALGHIHRPQYVGRENVRYCGTPLKYSFSEAGHDKSVTILEMKEKGNISVETVKLVPLHDVREIKGSYMELTDRKNYDGTALDDYLHITLTDDEEIPDAIGKLRTIYPNIMKLDYDNMRTSINGSLDEIKQVENKSPIEIFEEFYETQNNIKMNSQQQEFCSKLIQNIWEE